VSCQQLCYAGGLYNAQDLHAARRRTSPAEHGQGPGTARDEHRDLSYTYWDYRRGSWQKNLGLRIDHILLHPLVCLGRARASVDAVVVVDVDHVVGIGVGLLVRLSPCLRSSPLPLSSASLLRLSRALSHALSFHGRRVLSGDAFLPCTHASIQVSHRALRSTCSGGLEGQVADRLDEAGVDRWTRGWPTPSDHAPVWARFRLNLNL